MRRHVLFQTRPRIGCKPLPSQDRSFTITFVTTLVQGEIIYPPPPPHFGQKAFLMERGGGVYFEPPPPPRQDFYMPPSFVRPPPLEGYFLGLGGCAKFGPPLSSDKGRARDTPNLTHELSHESARENARGSVHENVPRNAHEC